MEIACDWGFKFVSDFRALAVPLLPALLGCVRLTAVLAHVFEDAAAVGVEHHAGAPCLPVAALLRSHPWGDVRDDPWLAHRGPVLRRLACCIARHAARVLNLAQSLVHVLELAALLLGLLVDLPTGVDLVPDVRGELPDEGELGPDGGVLDAEVAGVEVLVPVCNRERDVLLEVLVGARDGVDERAAKVAGDVVCRRRGVDDRVGRLVELADVGDLLGRLRRALEGDASGAVCDWHDDVCLVVVADEREHGVRGDPLAIPELGLCLWLAVGRGTVTGVHRSLEHDFSAIRAVGCATRGCEWQETGSGKGWQPVWGHVA